MLNVSSLSALKTINQGVFRKEDKNHSVYPLISLLAALRRSSRFGVMMSHYQILKGYKKPGWEGTPSRSALCLKHCHNLVVKIDLHTKYHVVTTCLFTVPAS